MGIGLVNEEVLLATGLFGEFRLDDVAVDADAIGFLIDRQQLTVVYVRRHL